MKGYVINPMMGCVLKPTMAWQSDPDFLDLEGCGLT
jgi:hypothetical protein